MSQLDSGSKTPARRIASRKLFAVSDYFILAAAFISFIFSVYLWFSDHRDAGLFVGLWVPSILSIGIYIKLQRESAKNG